MYESWVGDLEEKNEFAKHYAIFNGAFSNPEMAQKMMNEESSVSVSDADFERSSQMVLADRQKKAKQPQNSLRPHRRRRVINRE